MLIYGNETGARLAMEPDASRYIRDIGYQIGVSGLVVQVCFGILFIVVAGIFHYRISKTLARAAVVISKRWLKTVYGLVALITLRCIFRIAEYAGDGKFALLQYEYLPYLFDAVPISLVLLWLNWNHPYRLTNTSPFGYSLPSISTWHMVS